VRSEIILEAAGPSDTSLLSNLLELYIHDLSDVFPDIELGPDGRFGYNKHFLYWAEPDRRFAFLIKCDGRIALPRSRSGPASRPSLPMVPR